MRTFLGALLIVSGTTFCGMAAVRHLTRRARTLAALTSAMDYLESEIEFRLTPLPMVMGKMAQRYPVLEPLFGPCAQAITSESRFEHIWASALKAAPLPLRADEREVLLELGSVLGGFDAEGQQNALRLTKRRLSDMERLAGEERAAKSKLFGFLGVASGLVLVLFFL